jgi:hypothetical protein
MGGQKNFVSFTQRMRELHPKTWRPDERFFKDLIAKAIIFNSVARIVRKEFEGYRSQIAAYTVASISHRSADQFDLGLVWAQQTISSGLGDLIRDWSRRVAGAIIDSAGTRNVSEWCKKPECWRRIQECPMPWPDSAPPELGRLTQEGGGWGVKPTDVRRPLDPDELDAQRRCRELATGDWIRIVDWGSSASNLSPKQRELAAEIASIAAGGWTKELTARRAIEGRTIIKAAFEGGALDSSPEGI